LVAPVVIAGVQRAFDQQAAETGAVDEQVALDAAAILQLDGGDVAILGAQLDLADGGLDALGAALHRVLAQVSRVQAGVEMEGVGIRRAGRRHGEAVVARHDGRHRPVLVGRDIAVGARQVQPVHMGRAVVDLRAEIAEAVEEAVADVAPVLELDAQLERGLGLADKVDLVQAQRGVVVAYGRQGGFADAHRADLRRFDQHHLAALAQPLHQRRRGHPACRAAADDHDLAYGFVLHFFPVPWHFQKV